MNILIAIPASQGHSSHFGCAYEPGKSELISAESDFHQLEVPESLQQPGNK
jgi:hypothetical protein